MSIFNVLQERGFIQQCTDEGKLSHNLSHSRLVYYVGFDPTADSLHIGSLIPIMAMTHLQRAGHTPIAIIGGGTALIGDPSGRTEMRTMMTSEEIAGKGVKILDQLKRYLALDGEQGLFLNNADWLTGLNYIDFLRNVGRFFKVNEMIKVEAYRQRLEREEGLSFIEFNYQLLQAYDFLVLFERHGCNLQLGGDDQWGNILAGSDLIRRVKGESVFGLTFPLITTAQGQKMGKTHSGAIWLDAQKTSPYEFYQYWVNSDDGDVKRFLAYFTFLPMAEIQELTKSAGADLRRAKEVLAFEATKLAHGEAEAKTAQNVSKAVFGKAGEDSSALPTTVISRDRFMAGIPAADLFFETGLTTSKAAARRLIEQGGAYINGEKVLSKDMIVRENSLQNDVLFLRFGKKQHHRIVTK